MFASYRRIASFVNAGIEGGRDSAPYFRLISRILL